MNFTKIKTIAALVVMAVACLSMDAAARTFTPVYTYLTDASRLTAGETIDGSARILDLKGRKGVNPLSINTAIKLGAHNLNNQKGTAIVWFFALEDLGASFVVDHMRLRNKNMGSYTFLTDHPVVREQGNANFYFGWYRENEIRAQFFKGHVHPDAGFSPPQKAWVHAMPFNYFDQHQWYQLAFTWDADAKDMRLYVNGILVGTSDRFNRDFYRYTAGPTLYTGHPALCHGEVLLYDEVMSQGEIYDNYRATTTDFRPETETMLRHLFMGENLRDFTFQPGADWIKKLDLDLKDPEHIKHFYVQGAVESVKPGASKEGLLVETPEVSFERKNRDQQLYLWTNDVFEGNLYVEMDWMPLRHYGLSLMVVNASGMARERFMEDYPKQTTGQFWMVYKEDIRSYHCEFFREMGDVRNDIGSAFSRKNPFIFRNGFGSNNTQYAINEWHKLQILVIDGHFQVAVDGKVIMEFHDNSRTNTGCILNGGNIAIRCMLNTKILFRNLKVYNEKLPFTEVAHIGTGR